MSKDIVLLVLGVSLLASGVGLLHGVWRYTLTKTDSVEVWLVWCIAGMVGFLGFGGAGVAIWQGLGSVHPEAGLALGGGALCWCWAMGVLLASQTDRGKGY